MIESRDSYNIKDTMKNYCTYKNRNMWPILRRERQSMGISPQMTQILELADKDFKVAVIIMLSKESKVSGHHYSLILERV